MLQIDDEEIRQMLEGSDSDEDIKQAKLTQSLYETKLREIESKR